MSVNTFQVKIFNKFVDDLFSVLVTVDSSFVSLWNEYTHLKKNNEKVLVDFFKDVISQEARTLIFEKDEQYFATAMDTETFSWSKVIHVIGVHWQTISQDNKRKVWNFVQHMLVTSDKVTI